jgi:hypothetical protein
MDGWRIEGWFISVIAGYEATYVTPGFCLRTLQIRLLFGRGGTRNDVCARQPGQWLPIAKEGECFKIIGKTWNSKGS